MAEAAGSRSVLTLESNEYAATVHDGLIGDEKSAEGFGCWTRRGTLTVTSQGGQSEAVLVAGQRAWARRGYPVTPEPFVPSASVLEIRTSSPVLPLMRMPVPAARALEAQIEELRAWNDAEPAAIVAFPARGQRVGTD